MLRFSINYINFSVVCSTLECVNRATIQIYLLKMGNPLKTSRESPRVSKDRSLLNVPVNLVNELGGSYAEKLGINLNTLDPDEIYKWFLAAVLYGTRISEKIASRTWHELENRKVLTPKRVINIGWDKLVVILDWGGYVRYDYKTATKLLDISSALLDNYGGSLNTLHAAAIGPDDLEKRIMDLGKGVGKVTAGIFLRELRGRWLKADPSFSQLAFNAARSLGFLPRRIGNNRKLALAYLQHLWSDHGMTAENFPDFEAALVRKGVCLRHRAALISARSRVTKHMNKGVLVQSDRN